MFLIKSRSMQEDVRAATLRSRRFLSREKQFVCFISIGRQKLHGLLSNVSGCAKRNPLLREEGVVVSGHRLSNRSG